MTASTLVQHKPVGPERANMHILALSHQTSEYPYKENEVWKILSSLSSDAIHCVA